mgnify:FL=1
MKPAMPSLTRADEAALWSDVEAFLRDEVPAIPLPERQQDYLLDRFRLSIAELEGLPPAERARVVNVRDRHGNATTGLSHDVQGNLAVRNGLPHVFDFGNRLRSVADKEHYRYDAQGRRIVATAASGTLLSQYTQDGRLVFQQDHRAGGVMHEYLHLGNRLIARRDVGGARPGITYLHTDALGSPVASSNAAGQVVERTHHEPYGAAIGKVVDGPGYTGHVMDGLTGLVQMQQRYYDPETGRFLSVEPVKVYAIGRWLYFNYRRFGSREVGDGFQRGVPMSALEPGSKSTCF